jgi:hypothetical protein
MGMGSKLAVRWRRPPFRATVGGVLVLSLSSGCSTGSSHGAPHGGGHGSLADGGPRDAAVDVVAVTDSAAATPDSAAPDAAPELEAAAEAEASAPVKPLTPSGPVVIDGQDGGVVEGLKITSTTGDCVTLTNAFNVTVRSSDIGPCAGNAIVISGGGSITIADSYVHPEHPPTSCCDTGDGVFASNTSMLTISGNVIAYGEANIEVQNSVGITVSGNFLLNPQNGGSRGQNFQAWSNCSNVTVENNYALSSLDPSYTFPEKQEDSINFGITSGIVAKGNYVQGGHSPSGCGIIADDGAVNATFSNNTLVDTGQCGLSIANGTNQSMDGNRVINSTPVAGGGNTAIVVWNQYAGACGPVGVTNNVASELKPDMTTESGYWNGGGCDPVTLTGNTFDSAARAMLTPVAQKLPPPLIPPAPVNCVAPSPYANQTGFPPCGG